MIAAALRVGPGVPVEHGNEPVCRVPRHFAHGLMDGGERRPGGSRHFRIVEARDREVLWNGQAKVARRCDRGDRHVVVLGKNRSGADWAVEELQRDPVTDIIGEVARADERVVDRNRSLLECLPIALQASPACGVRRIAQDDADAAMPERQHMRGDGMTRSDLVHRHDQPAVEIAVRGDASIRKPLPFDHVEQHRLIARGRCQQYAVEPGAQEQLA